jgi:hypothetical protein
MPALASVAHRALRWRMHGNRRFFAGPSCWGCSPYYRSRQSSDAAPPLAPAIHGRICRHGAAGYVATAALVVLVGAGVAIGGTAAGWLVACRSFPGSRFFAWALLLPLAMPAYVMAYAYTDFLQYAGPVQTALRETFGWSHDDYWFPEVRSLPGAAAMFVFTLYPYV